MKVFEVNKDWLFSFSRSSEAFLQSILAQLNAMSWRTSPDDLMLMADCPGRQLWVVVEAVPTKSGALPEVLAVCETVYEGKSVREVALSQPKNLNRIVDAAHPGSDFSQLTGIRLERVGGDWQHIRYLVRKLLDHFSHAQVADEEAEQHVPDFSAFDKLLRGDLAAPTVDIAEALRPLKHVVNTLPCAYFGTVCEIQDFAGHFQQLKFLPVHLLDRYDDGRYQIIVLSPVGAAKEQNWPYAFSAHFGRRLLRWITTQFRSVDLDCVISILDTSRRSRQHLLAKQTSQAQFTREHVSQLPYVSTLFPQLQALVGPMTLRRMQHFDADAFHEATQSDVFRVACLIYFGGYLGECATRRLSASARKLLLELGMLGHCAQEPSEADKKEILELIRQLG